jgi:hypothetical protein
MSKTYVTEEELEGGFVEPKLIEVENLFIRMIRGVFSYHCFNKGDHSDNSQHVKGKASDGHYVAHSEHRKPTPDDWIEVFDNLEKIINNPHKTFFDIMLIARVCGFNGLGFYKNWKANGKRKPGFHKDIRDFDNSIVWVCVNRKELDSMMDKKDKELASKGELCSDSDQFYIYLT